MVASVRVIDGKGHYFRLKKNIPKTLIRNAPPHGDGCAVLLHWLNVVACQHARAVGTQAALVVELSIPLPAVDGTANSDAQGPHGGAVLHLQSREPALYPGRGRAASPPEAALHRV